MANPLQAASPPASPPWSTPAQELLQRLGSKPAGLGAAEAQQRLAQHGPNQVHEKSQDGPLRMLWQQVKNPLVLILLVAAAVSVVAGEPADAVVVLVIVVASTGLGFWREFKASKAAQALMARMEVRCRVVRDGVAKEMPATQVVPGDVVELNPGAVVPADGVCLETQDLYASQSILTGETFPEEKRPGVVAPNATLAQRTNMLFMGSSIRSGTGRMLVVETGARTQFGAMAEKLRLTAPETEFDRGLRHFGGMLSYIMLIMLFVVFAANVLLHRPPVESLLFSVALAVGLTPELLPAILNYNLSHSALAMAQLGVLVRRLAAIENLGSMDVLCTDKTGTLTLGVVDIQDAVDTSFNKSPRVMALTVYNAALQLGLPNGLDQAILSNHAKGVALPKKLGEVPYDFIRRRLSVMVETPQGPLLITKGAFQAVLDVCSSMEGGAPLDAAAKARLQERFLVWSQQGCRVLTVATRLLPPGTAAHRDLETGMTLEGLLAFSDGPKPDAAEAVAELKRLGVAVKMITGDNQFVAAHVAETVGLGGAPVITGAQLDQMRDEALWNLVMTTRVFAEVDPNQKERLILALKKRGAVVGYLGDGINDAPALHAADVSISVETAVDVAKQAADIVLTKASLNVLAQGIQAGRTTFANTLKYVLTTTSANLGNMLSMAVVSLVLPFLPLLAGQVLLNNFLSDIPALGLATDSVDPDLVDRPRRWDMVFIRRFMVQFGLLSSVFDMATFAILLWGFHAAAPTFRTAWFVESLVTEVAIALVVRTRMPLFKSRPGNILLVSSLVVLLCAFAVPYLPWPESMGFTPLPWPIPATLALVVMAYVASAEVLKVFFFRKHEGVRGW